MKKTDDENKNGENQTNFIEIIKYELLKKKRQSLLRKLRCNERMYLTDILCPRITVNSADVMEELVSDQKGADTNIVLHAKRAFHSTVGDAGIDFLFIAVSLMKAYWIYLD